MMEQDIVHFFDQHMDSLPLYEAFESRVRKEITDIRIKVQKTQISFYNRHLIDAASEPYPNRWTHHVLVSDRNEIDDELMGWIKEAAAFSDKK